MSKHFRTPEGTEDPVLAGVLKLGRPGDRRDGPTTLVGRVGMQPGLGFAAENERLKAERAAGMVILRLDPKTIGTTDFANRHESSLSCDDPKFQSLKASIRTNGQDNPIRVRPATAASTIEYEIVEGHRRHAAILELDRETEGGWTILARLDAKATEARDLVLKMYRENAEREDLSPYETGCMFSQWLAAELFPNQAAIAEATGQSKQNVGKYLGVAALPDYVLQAFGDPRAISLRWASPLSKTCEEREAETRRAAAQLSKQQPRADAEMVFAILTRSSPVTSDPGTGARASEAIKEGNKILFELSARGGRYGIRLGKHVDPKLHGSLQRELKEWLHDWLRKHNGRSA